MVVGEIDHFGIVERPFRHDLRMPVCRPAFIHDFGLSLRREVIGFFPKDPQDIALPVFHWRALDQKQKDVFLRLFRKAPAFQAFVFEFLFLLVHELLRIDEFVHVFAGRDLSHDGRLLIFRRPFVPGPSFDEHGVMVDEIIERETYVDEVFNPLEPEPVDILPDFRGVIRHCVHHFAIRSGEPDIVLEEIAVTVNVGHDDLLIDEMIVLQQVRVARVIVDDHFVNLVKTVRIALVEALVLHAELPVGIPIRDTTVSGHHVHFFEIEHLENRLVKIQAILARVLFDLAIEPRQFRCQRLSSALNGDGHYLPFPRKSLMDW